MTVLAVVQARMGSSRLPGKVLRQIEGRPMLAFMLDRLGSAPVDQLLVATSTATADDAVAELARSVGVPCVRGSEADVLSRFALAVQESPADTVVRLTGDCPLIDPQVIAEAIDLRRQTGAPYVSNTLIRTFPDGLDVEVVASEALLAATAEAKRSDEREHVTPFIYRRPQRFPLVALRTDRLAGDERWTVDTAEDLQAVRSVASLLRNESLSWEQILDRIGRRHQVPPGALHLRPAVAADADRLLQWRNDPTAVAMSRSRSPLDPDAHSAWFDRALRDPSRRMWIGEVDGVPVGQVRVDVADGGHGMVSIAVGPEHRGKGHARALLLAMHGALRADLQLLDLTAEIDPANLPSISAFTKAGYEPAPPVDGFIRMRWVR